ncbi:MAG: hypothetical protein HRT45_10375 [Bdellovibrionales bacterium]|nr:hypothetical protein [Bdellovibrionales bacterium]
MKAQIQFFSLIFLLLVSFNSRASYSNYNSLLIGPHAAGLGGAYTSLTDDASAIPFYNPANLARIDGNKLSAAVTLFNKYDRVYDADNSFESASLRVNQGAITPIPSAAGSAFSFGNFALGISIVVPGYEAYNGVVQATQTTNSFLNINDRSLWVGGVASLNLTEKDSVGITMYYTSRDYSRAVTDKTESGGETTVFNEEKVFTQNSLIYILGYGRQLTKKWRFGASYRFTSLPISGQGTLFQTETSTTGTATSETFDREANTVIPDRLALGISYKQKHHRIWSFDLHYYGRATYRDLDDQEVGDLVEHVPTVNASLGYEHYWANWISIRLGLFSNLSSHEEVDVDPSSRQPNHIDMWGWSGNLGIYTNKNSTITLGGYYSGGKGYSSQRVRGELKKIKFSDQIFSFVVGTSYQF